MEQISSGAYNLRSASGSISRINSRNQGMRNSVREILKNSRQLAEMVFENENCMQVIRPIMIELASKRSIELPNNLEESPHFYSLREDAYLDISMRTINGRINAEELEVMKYVLENRSQSDPSYKMMQDSIEKSERNLLMRNRQKAKKDNPKASSENVIFSEEDKRKADENMASLLAELALEQKPKAKTQSVKNRKRRNK